MTELRDSYDVLVVGGGVNGTGIARDAAGRGLSVLLCEQDDLASHTSSASTKLIHGGLRYLEGFHFALVRKALKEREVLLAAAPHIMRPLRFVMPHDAHLRPMWMIRAGLLLYDNLARREHLAASASLNLRKHPAGNPLKPQFNRGFIYSDGWTDDARLVVLNARSAAEHGAKILTRTRCESITADGVNWIADLRANDGTRRVSARSIVNASGPWVSEFLRERSPSKATHRLRLVKGSHIVVPQLFAHRFAYIFQNTDRRIVFAIPYEEHFTLVGTTDVDYAGDLGSPRADPQEVEYLCATVNRYFARQTTPAEVVWSYSGVRPLLADDAADPSRVTRDYALDFDASRAPLLSIFGGKITTYRRLAEVAVNQLMPRLGMRSRMWTVGKPLPGGDLPGGSFAVFLRALVRRYPWLPEDLRQRYARAYGTRIHQMLEGASAVADLGAEILPRLHEREIEYLRREEWAQTGDDILWRRTKLGLHLPPDSAARLDEWLLRRH